MARRKSCSKGEQALKKMLYQHQGDFDDYLPNVVLHLNDEFNRATGTTPFMMDHLRDPYLPEKKLNFAIQEPDKRLPEVHLLEKVGERRRLTDLVAKTMEEARALQRAEEGLEGQKITCLRARDDAMLQVEADHVGLGDLIRGAIPDHW